MVMMHDPLSRSRLISMSVWLPNYEIRISPSLITVVRLISIVGSEEIIAEHLADNQIFALSN